MLLLIICIYDYLNLQKYLKENRDAYKKHILPSANNSISELIYKEDLKTHDKLTGLRNRLYFFDKVQFLISEKTEFTLLFLHIEGFKTVINKYGYEKFDELVAETGEHLTSTQGSRLITSRFEDYGFAFIYKNTDHNKINELTNNLKTDILQILKRKTEHIKFNINIGISRFPEDGENSKDLYKIAAEAMNISTNYQNNDYIQNTKEAKKYYKQKRKVIQELKNMNISEDLTVDYQPRFEFASDNVIGAEALIRWKHPEIGLIEPYEFIPIAEDLEIIDDITRWIISTSIRQITTWNKQYNTDLILSINLSSLSMQKSSFLDYLKTVIIDTKCNPKWIVVEFTENILFESPVYMKKLMDSISNMGIHIHLDDYGVDMTSLLNLKEFNITSLKIDNKLVSYIGINRDKEDVIKSIILLSQGLGLKSAAEGVETKEQHDFLKEHGCCNYQGYYRERPISSYKFEQKYLNK